MSRLHEALRRTVSDGSEPLREIHTQDALFQSAWATGAEDPHRPADNRFSMPPPAMAPKITAHVNGFASGWRERLARAPDGDAVVIEQFRRLAATLHHAQSANGLKIVMVTSATPNDGKTLTSINLALVLSESYRRRVLLVDADLRRPSIPDVVEFSSGAGLSETLRADTEQKLALVQLSPTLTLLPAGQPMPDPIGVLTSPRMRHILEEASSRFDWVILDAPPVGPLADASLLGEMVDGTLFVIRAGQTQYPHIQKAIEAIGRDRLLGVVLNGMERTSNPSYERYGNADQTSRAVKSE